MATMMRLTRRSCGSAPRTERGSIGKLTAPHSYAKPPTGIAPFQHYSKKKLAGRLPISDRPIVF